MSVGTVVIHSYSGLSLSLLLLPPLPFSLLCPSPSFSLLLPPSFLPPPSPEGQLSICRLHQVLARASCPFTYLKKPPLLSLLSQEVNPQNSFPGEGKLNKRICFQYWFLLQMHALFPGLLHTFLLDGSGPPRGVCPSFFSVRIDMNPQHDCKPLWFTKLPNNRGINNSRHLIGWVLDEIM